MMNAIAKRLRALLALGCLLALSPTVALAVPGAGDTVDLIGVRVTDVKGQHHRIGVSMGKGAAGGAGVPGYRVPGGHALRADAQQAPQRCAGGWRGALRSALEPRHHLAGERGLRGGLRGHVPGHSGQHRRSGPAFGPPRDVGVFRDLDRRSRRLPGSHRRPLCRRRQAAHADHVARPAHRHGGAGCRRPARGPMRPRRSAASTTTGAGPARTARGRARSPTTATSRRCSKPTASSATGMAASPPSPSKATTTRSAGTAWSPS